MCTLQVLSCIHDFYCHFNKEKSQDQFRSITISHSSYCLPIWVNMVYPQVLIINKPVTNESLTITHSPWSGTAWFDRPCMSIHHHEKVLASYEKLRWNCCMLYNTKDYIHSLADIFRERLHWQTVSLMQSRSISFRGCWSAIQLGTDHFGTHDLLLSVQPFRWILSYSCMGIENTFLWTFLDI